MIYIHLYHGRKTCDEKLEDWGEDGPVLGPFNWFHGTYFSTFQFGNERDDREWWLEDNPGFKDGLIYYDGMYYGDFEIVSREDRTLVERAEPFDRRKAVIETQDSNKVKICVRGGVAESKHCPDAVTVEIHDYDNDVT